MAKKKGLSLPGSIREAAEKLGSRGGKATLAAKKGIFRPGYKKPKRKKKGKKK